MLLHLVLHGNKPFRLEDRLVDDRNRGLLELALEGLELILQKLLHVLLVGPRGLIDEVIQGACKLLFYQLPDLCSCIFQPKLTYLIAND